MVVTKWIKFFENILILKRPQVRSNTTYLSPGLFKSSRTSSALRFAARLAQGWLPASPNRHRIYTNRSVKITRMGGWGGEKSSGRFRKMPLWLPVQPKLQTDRKQQLKRQQWDRRGWVGEGARVMKTYITDIRGAIKFGG